MGLFVSGYAAVTGVRALVRSILSPSRGRTKIQFVTPFIELDVKPVSEGDKVRYAYHLDGKYTALIENRRKKARLDIEADSEEELARKVQDTFRAWSVVGKKEPGRS
jgi:hypothetical protein